nr:hypothetical protein [uncultured Haemophilus sp.]
MSRELITTTDGILIYRDSAKEKKANPSILLINDLVKHFLIPKYDDHGNLLDALAFYGVCYLALMKELKGTEALKWINRNLCDVYSHNGGFPLEQTLEKYAETKSQKGE